MPGSRIRLVAVTTILLLAGGCGPVAYVMRAGWEEARILWRRQPIEEILAEPLDEATREKLELTLETREFARDRLGLDVDGSYASLSSVDDGQMIHVVTAAPWNRLEPYRWWFPVVGSVPYRGYFSAERAHALAAELAAEGYDTNVRRTVAFSTLGWFDDPLLSHLLEQPASVLVTIIVHELTHNTAYFPGQAAFNESLATFVGCRGAELFFGERQRPEEAERVRSRCADTWRFADYLGSWVERLRQAYARGITRAERSTLFRRMQQDYERRHWDTNRYGGFAKIELDNAVILQQWIYLQRLDLFDRVLLRHDGDLAATVRWIIASARDRDDPFRALEAALATPRVAAASRRWIP